MGTSESKNSIYKPIILPEIIPRKIDRYYSFIYGDISIYKYQDDRKLLFSIDPLIYCFDLLEVYYILLCNAKLILKGPFGIFQLSEKQKIEINQRAEYYLINDKSRPNDRFLNFTIKSKDVISGAKMNGTHLPISHSTSYSGIETLCSFVEHKIIQPNHPILIKNIHKMIKNREDVIFSFYIHWMFEQKFEWEYENKTIIIGWCIEHKNYYCLSILMRLPWMNDIKEKSIHQWIKKCIDGEDIEMFRYILKGIEELKKLPTHSPSIWELKKYMVKKRLPVWIDLFDKMVIDHTDEYSKSEDESLIE